ncbi:LuxR C-terminal-related transcriptional regulator [Streptomyces canus]|uniref:LuxR C-terminal-related transcriptional regulator n=1 Tax=Streptomyces canus TaxID=58343 RepID=UPI00386E4C34|nr:response regulator transcription factor [Streptomyces canus]
MEFPINIARPSENKTIVAEPEEFARMGMCHFLESDLGLDVVGQAADSRQLVDLALQKRPHLMICDLDLDPLSGFDFVLRIRERMGEDSPRILLLGREADNDRLLAALSVGIDGVVCKKTAHSELSAAIGSAAQGYVFLSPRFVTQLLSNFTLLPANASPITSQELRNLTERELEVLGLIAEGLSNDEIARKLHLAETTVKVYSSHLFEKLGVRDRLQAALLAIRVGMIKPMISGPLRAGRGPTAAAGT